MAEQAAIDAMSAALGDLAAGNTVKPADEVEVVVPDTGTDTGTVSDDGKVATDAEKGGEGTEGEEDDGEEGGEEAAPELPATEADIDKRRKDGTFKSKAEIEAEKAAIRDRDAKAAAGGEPAKEPAKDAAKAPVKDPVNDPIPDGLKGETKERMTKLVGLVKERDGVIEQQQILFDAIANTGADADEFGNMLSYMRWSHSDKPEDLEAAHQMLTHELRAVAIKLGKPTAGVDLLAEHPELVSAVEAGTLTRDVANEVAISRERTKQAAARTAAQAQNATQQQTSQQQAIDAGRQALTDLGITLSEVDPQYERLKPLVIQSLGSKLTTIPPSQWVATFRAEYKKVALLHAASAAPPQGGAQRQQPLRSNKQPTGQGQKQPSNGFEAMKASLSELAGR